MFYYFDKIYELICEFYKFQSSFEYPYSRIYESISCLARKTPNLLINKLPDILPYIVNGIKSEDSKGSIEVLKCFITLLKVYNNKLSDFIQEIAESLFENINCIFLQQSFDSILSNDISIPQYLMSGFIALKAFCKIICIFDANDYLNFILNVILKISQYLNIKFFIRPFLSSLRELL